MNPLIYILSLKNDKMKSLFDKEVSKRTDKIVSGMIKDHMSQKSQVEKRHKRDLAKITEIHSDKIKALKERQKLELIERDKSINILIKQHDLEIKKQYLENKKSLEIDKNNMQIKMIELESSKNQYEKSYNKLIDMINRVHETHLMLVNLVSTSSKVDLAFAEAIKFKELLKEGTAKLESELTTQKKELKKMQLLFAKKEG